MFGFGNSCRTYRQTISLLAGGVLSGAERSAAEEHLAGCAGCREYFAEVARVAGGLGRLKEGVKEVEPTVGAKARWRREVVLGGEKREVGNRIGWRELFWPYRQAWVGMAAVWVVMWLLNWGSSGSVGGNRVSGEAPMAGLGFEDERRMLAELLPPMARDVEAPRRKAGPRSEVLGREWVG